MLLKKKKNIKNTCLEFLFHCQGYWHSAVLHSRKASAQQGRCSWFPMGHPHGPAILPYLSSQDKPPVSPTRCLLLLILHRQPHLLLYCGKKEKGKQNGACFCTQYKTQKLMFASQLLSCCDNRQFVFPFQSQSLHLCFGAISFSPSYIHYTGPNA